MDSVMASLSEHPAMLKALVIFAIIIILYFIFKQFIKLALVILAVVIVAVGYYYFQNPHKVSERVKESVDTVKSGSDEIVNKGKSFYKDSKELIDKTTKVPGDINKLLKNADETAGKQ